MNHASAASSDAPSSVAVPESPSRSGFQAGANVFGRRAAVVVLGSLLVAVCAHVSIPLWFTPVPITLQTFAVLFLGLALPPGLAAATMVAYLLEGMAGLPVFSPVGAASFLHLFGPTGGYLLSYPFAAAAAGWLRRRIGKGGGFGASLGAAALASVVILLAGAAWLGIATHQSATAVFVLAVAPFLPGDILKAIAAAGAAVGVRRWRRG